MASTFTSLAPPPEGITPNFIDPSDTLYPEIVATMVLCVSLTTVFTGARLIAKRSIASFALEDCSFFFPALP